LGKTCTSYKSKTPEVLLLASTFFHELAEFAKTSN